MAHVLLIGASATGTAITALKTELQAQGHTVTMSSSAVADLAAVSLTGVDVIGTLLAVRTDVGPWLRDRWAEGYPILLCGVDSGATNFDSNSVAKDLGLIATPYAVSTSSAFPDTNKLTNIVAHPITAGLTPGSTVTVHTDRVWSMRDRGTPAGTTIARSTVTGYSPGDGVYMTAVETGDALLTASVRPGPTSPARAVFAGWVYPSITFTATGKTVIGQAVNWLATPVVEPITAEFTSTGSLAVDGTVEHRTGSANFTGAGVLNAGPFSEHRVHDVAAFTGTGSLTAAQPEHVVIPLAQFDGLGQLVAAQAEGVVVDVVAFAGAGQLTAARADHTFVALAAFTGAGQLTVTGEIPPPVEPLVEVRTILRQAPGAVLVSLAELEPDQTVTVNIVDPAVDNPVLVTETGEEGTSEFTIPVPTLLAGTYTVEILVGTTILLAELVVLTAPLDSTPEPDEFAYVAPPPFDAEHLEDEHHPRHWKFHDPVTGREHTFTHNPIEWSGIERPSWFEFDASTAPDGQVLTWQAAGRGEPFEFRGYLSSESEHDELLFWAKLRRRFWMRDHRNRYWLIVLEQFDARRRIVPNKRWAHDYTVKGIQFMGPVNPQRWDRVFEHEG